jgi:DNA-binding MarR family transcriptional regulator
METRTMVGKMMGDRTGGRARSDDFGIARVNVTASPLFLRASEVERGVALLLAGHAHLLQRAEPLLRANGIGRAHFRMLTHVVRWPGLSVGDLVLLSGTSKQAVGRVLRDLGTRALVDIVPGARDRRQRLVTANTAGAQLARDIEAALSAGVAEAYASAGQNAVTGFWQVLEGLLPVATRMHHAELERRRAPGG